MMMMYNGLLPTTMKNEDEEVEPEVTLPTWSKDSSADAEMYDNKNDTQDAHKQKTPKVVKF